MKKNIYISGISGTKKEFEQIKKIFEQYGIDNLTYFGFGDFKQSRYCRQNRNFLGATSINLHDQLDNNCDYNLICHSAGCNYGIMVTEANVRIRDMRNGVFANLNKLVLISPELLPISKDEQLKIDELNTENNYFNEKQNNSVLSLLRFALPGKMKLIRQYEQTRVIANEILDKGLTSIIARPTLIIHSTGDRFVSQEGINKIVTCFPDTEEYRIDSTMHNPLLSEEKGPVLAKKIGEFLK